MKTVSSTEVHGWMSSLESDLKNLSRDLDKTAMIGIKTGGVQVAARLHEALNLTLPLGQLNISFYRDDFSRIGLHPVVEASDIPFSVEGMHVILVDDVLHTGRTIRAALNEIFDYGRPAVVTLAVLIDREGRELPIQADVTGKKMSMDTDQQIKLNADTMEFQIGKVEEFT